MGKVTIRQHEPLRVPNGWTEQAKAFVMQVERIFDRLFSLLAGKKDKQEPVASPETESTSLAFISTIEQDENGVITATKKKVSIANNLTTSSENYVLDARQGKALNDALSPIGTIVTGTNSTSLSVSSATETILSRLSLTKGLWLLIGGFDWSNSMEGQNQASWIKYTTNSSAAAGDGTVTPGAIIRNKAYGSGGMNVASYFNNTSNTTYYLRLLAYQTSGSAKTAHAVSLTAIRIK